MKRLMTSWTFDASARTIEFVGTSSDHLEQLILITNTTDGIIIYSFADPAKSGTLVGNTITLDYDTTSMDDADALQIRFDTLTEPIDDVATNTASTTAALGSVMQDATFNQVAADDGADVTGNRMIIIGGKDGDGNGQILSTDTNGVITLPVGAATSANQQTDGLTDTELRSSPVPVSGSITASGTVTANLGTLNDAATSAKQDTGNASVASVDAKTPALGQALAASSVPVILPSATITTLTPPAAITGFATSVKQDTLLTELQLKADLTETQPVSLASVPAHSVNAGTNLNTSALALESGGNLATIAGAIKAEDAAHTTGDLGVQVLAKRTDSAASSATTDGDYSTLNTDNTGRLWVNVGANTATSVTPGTAATNLGKAEDAVHASGDVGVMALAVRNDNASTTFGADGDYSPLATDLKGRSSVRQIAPTATLTNVASSATSVTILIANSARVAATVYNDSTQVLYLKFGATASATSFTVPLATNTYYEVPGGYTGIIDGIWASSNGNARVTEIT